MIALNVVETQFLNERSLSDPIEIDFIFYNVTRGSESLDDSDIVLALSKCLVVGSMANNQ